MDNAHDEMDSAKSKEDLIAVGRFVWYLVRYSCLSAFCFIIFNALMGAFGVDEIIGEDATSGISFGLAMLIILASNPRPNKK